MLNSDEGQLVIVVYVDDIIFGGDKVKLCHDFALKMKNEFEMSMIGELSYFLGLQVSQRNDGLVISQVKYVKELLKKFGMAECKPVSTPMPTACKLSKDEDGKGVDQKEYRSMIGSLLYLTATRPDILHSVCQAARYQSNPKESHLVAVKRILRYIRGTSDFGLWYTKNDGIKLIGYSDADWAGCTDDRRSTSGGAFFLGKKCVSWLSKKQDSVSLSTAEAEYVAATSACTQVIWMRRQLLDMVDEVRLPISIMCDNQSAIGLGKNPIQHSRSKHIDIRYHFLKEKVEEGVILMEYVPTEEQVADIFTKPLPTATFEKHRLSLGVQPIPSN